MKKIKITIKNKKVENIKINTEYIKLDSFLKYANVVSSGGEAKIIIKDGLIKVNNAVCRARGKKIYQKDFVEYDNVIYKISEE